MTSRIVVNNIEPDAGISSVTVDGGLTVTGVLKYEDVKNVDSVGLITARSGIRVTAGDVGINVTPTSDDMGGATPKLHVLGISTDGQFNTVARFQAGGDADSTGAMIAINHSNDRGLAIQGGRISGNYSHGALKMIDFSGRLSAAMVIHGGAGQGINDISFFTGASTTTTNRLHIQSDGKLLIGSTNASNNARLGNELCIVGTEAYTGMSITNYPGTNASHAGLIDFNRSRGTSDQSMTSVVASDKLGELIFRGSNGSGFADAVTLRGYADTVDGSYVNGKFEISTGLAGSMNVRLRISKEGYVTKPTNPVFHAFGGASEVNAGNDIVFGQESFDVGGGYNTSTGEYTAPATGYYHFYAQVYRQTTSSDSWWGYYLDTGSGYSQISESRIENDANGHTGSGYSTLQCSIYWYMTAGHKIKCRVGNIGAIHCNNIELFLW